MSSNSALNRHGGCNSQPTAKSSSNASPFVTVNGLCAWEGAGNE